jgi:hypothetical protein
MLLFANTTYSQNWEAGTGLGVYSFRNIEVPPYSTFEGAKGFTAPTLNIYIKRTTKHFNYEINIDYFRRNVSSLDTMKVPIANIYPRSYKDSIGFNNKWKSNYYSIRFDCSYHLFNIKKAKNYIGLSAGVLLEHEQFIQNQTIIDNNNESLYLIKENLQDFFLGVNYQINYRICKNINIQNVLSLSVITGLYGDYTTSFNRWPMIFSDNIGVGYRF